MNYPALFRSIVFASILCAPILIFVATQTETNTQDVHTWLPNGTPERQTYDEFLGLFGHDDDILVSWDGCSASDPRLEELTDRLCKHTFDDGCFRGVINGQTVLDGLAENRLGLSEQAAKRRLANVFLGPDGKTTGIVIQLSDCGRQNRKACVNTLMAEVKETKDLNAEDVRVGGSSYISSQIDKSTNQALLLSIPAIFLSFLVTFCCLKTWRLTVITLWSAGLCALTSVALVTGLGFKINGLLVLMPVLVLVLALSGCIHLCSYYRTVLLESPNKTAVELALDALAYGWRPSSMAMLTTSVGILMLSTSHIEAVRHFGAFSALSIIVALAISLSVFPALLAIWPASEKEKKFLLRTSVKRQSKPTISKTAWRNLATLTLLFVIFAGPMAFMGLEKLTTTLCPTKMFLPSSEVNRNYTWINENWTSLESVEVLVKFPKDEGKLLDQMMVATQFHAVAQKAEHVESAFSIANLSPPVSRKKSAKGVAQRRTLDAKLNEQKEELINRRLIAENDQSRFWRIRLGVEVGNDRDYEGLLAEVNKNVAGLSEKLESPPEVILTGIWPLSAAGRHQLFNDLAASFLMAFAIITPVVMIILRGFLVGLVAMIPNVFPALLFFGSLGWIGKSVDIGMILTASVGMGIAVDDTLHFIEWYVRERKKEPCAMTAVKKTVSQCARPMFFTTLICGAGLIVFAFSQFVPPSQFAYAIVALLALSLVSDLILLPALIVGPLGFVFESNKLNAEQTEPEPNIIRIAIPLAIKTNKTLDASKPQKRAA